MTAVPILSVNINEFIPNDYFLGKNVWSCCPKIRSPTFSLSYVYKFSLPVSVIHQSSVEKVKNRIDLFLLEALYVFVKSLTNSGQSVVVMVFWTQRLPARFISSSVIDRLGTILFVKKRFRKHYVFCLLDKNGNEMIIIMPVIFCTE